MLNGEFLFVEVAKKKCGTLWVKATRLNAQSAGLLTGFQVGRIESMDQVDLLMFKVEMIKRR